MSQERRVSQPNLHSVSHSAMRRPSLPNSETSLPTRAGNTINNFWKSMYLEQLDQSNQSDGSLSERGVMPGKVHLNNKRVMGMKAINAQRLPFQNGPKSTMLRKRWQSIAKSILKS